MVRAIPILFLAIVLSGCMSDRHVLFPSARSHSVVDVGNPIDRRRASEIRSDIEAAVERAELESSKFPEPTPFPDVNVPKPGFRKFDWSGEDLLAKRDAGLQEARRDLLLTIQREEVILAAERFYSMNKIQFAFVAAFLALSPGTAFAQQEQSPDVFTLVDELVELDLDENGVVEAYEVDALLSAAEEEAFASWEREWYAAFALIGSEAPDSVTRAEFHDVLRQGLATLDLNGDGLVTLEEWKWRTRESEEATLLFGEIGGLMNAAGMKEVPVSDLQSFIDAAEAASELDIVSSATLPTDFNAYRNSVMVDFNNRAVDGVIKLKTQ